MANRVGFTDEGALNKSAVSQTALALSKMRLFKEGLTPTRSTLKADFTANEADFDGYTSGGYAVTAFNGPVINSAGGASLFNAENVPAYGPVASPPVTNRIGGFWLETTGGDVWNYVQFDQAIPMEKVGDGFPLALELTDGFTG